MSYYGIVRNRRSIASFLHNLFNSSCAKLLASKFSLSSQNKVKKKLGSDLVGRGTIMERHPSLAPQSDVINALKPAELR